MTELMRGHDSRDLLRQLLVQRIALAGRDRGRHEFLRSRRKQLRRRRAARARCRGEGGGDQHHSRLRPGAGNGVDARDARRGKFDQLDEIHIRVGGLPQDPQPPLDYQLVFSVEGLINEYIELARVIRDGKITEVDSMTEIEELSFDGFPPLEAFQTSGGTSTLPERFSARSASSITRRSATPATARNSRR